MSNTDSFIDEVTEEVRRDRLYAFFRRWAWLGILIVVAVVGTAAFLEWQKVRHAAAAARAGDALLDALEADDPAERATALAASGVGGPLPLLLIAGQDMLAGDRDAAIATLQALAADTRQPGVYRDLAALRAVMLQTGITPPEDRITALQPLAIPGATFAPLAEEQIALARIEAGDLAGARATLDALLADAATSSSLRNRAAALRTALGDDATSGGDGS
ncbi:MAG: hypothetical protein H3C51_08170 [Rubellimicrobium sp.]|nr:hypothetical protein [Rubellimicrobium sp.]